MKTYKPIKVSSVKDINEPHISTSIMNEVIAICTKIMMLYNSIIKDPNIELQAIFYKQIIKSINYFDDFTTYISGFKQFKKEIIDMPVKKDDEILKMAQNILNGNNTKVNLDDKEILHLLPIKEALFFNILFNATFLFDDNTECKLASLVKDMVTEKYAMDIATLITARILTVAVNFIAAHKK